jgi:hypothetical protein
LLLAASALLALVGHAKRRSADPLAWHWLGLSAVFLFLSIDEGAALHERLADPVRAMVSSRSLLFQAAWMAPYAVLVVAFASAYYRFVRSLPRATMWLFVGAGCLYVGGALGGELLGALHHQYLSKRYDIMYVALIAIEESMEMLGTIAFIYAIVKYMETDMSALRIGVTRSPLKSLVGRPAG